MIKVLFESSIFLHQKVGGISRYITTLNKCLSKYGVSSKFSLLYQLTTILIMIVITFTF